MGICIPKGNLSYNGDAGVVTELCVVKVVGAILLVLIISSYLQLRKRNMGILGK